MKRSILFAFLSTFLFGFSAHAESFFSSDAYWKGKTAYSKGDFSTAMKLWQGAADKGVGEAEGFIGALYHGGQGVEKDPVKAMQWYQKAAVKRVAQAQLGIGSLYADGLGVDKDYIKARMWFSIAAHNGSERAEYNLKKIAQRMTEKEIMQAEEMAMTWVKKYQR